MSTDSISVIREAEKQAEASEREAKEQAAEIISRAHSEAKEVVSAKISAAKADAEAKLAELMKATCKRQRAKALKKLKHFVLRQKARNGKWQEMLLRCYSNFSGIHLC